MKTIYLLVVSLLLTTSQLSAQNLVWKMKSAPVARETYAVAFSHNGEKVFSGSECGPTYLRIFDAYTGTEEWQNQVDSPLMCAQGVKFNSNGTKVVTLEELGNMLIYDFSTTPPTKLQTVDLGTSYSFALAFNPAGDKIATACSDKKLLIHNVNTGAEIHSIDAHANWVTYVDWSSKEQIATCGNDMKIKLWDSAGNFIREMAAGHTASVSCLKFSPDGNYIASGSKDKNIIIWDVATGNIVKTLTGHTSEIKQIDITDDGTQMLSGSFDETVKLWDFPNGSLLKSFNAGGGRVFSVDFMPNSTRYITVGTSNGDVQVWDMRYGTSINDQQTTNSITAYPNPVVNQLFIANDNKIKSLQLYDISGKEIPCSYQINTTKATVDVQNVIDGHYYIKINMANKTEYYNFVKTK